MACLALQVPFARKQRRLGSPVISNLLAASNGGLLVPLALVIAATVVAKGVFSLHRSRSQDRKEFLDVWGRDHPDDLWLEVAVRHLSGTYLPAKLIRMLRTSPQAGRAILEIAQSWPLLEMDDTNGDMRWASDRHATSRKRRSRIRALGVGYFVGMGLGGWLGLRFLEGSGPSHAIFWVYPIAGIMVGMVCLYKAEQLETANRAVPRWLGLP